MRGRLTFLLLWLMPLTFMGAAWLMYSTGIGVPQGTHNHGYLLEPPLHIADALPELKGWTLLLPFSGRCAEECRQRLYLSRQAHIALGRHAWRLQRLYWNNREPAEGELEFFRTEHPGMLIHSYSHKRKGAAPAKWLAQLRLPQNAPQWRDYFYVINPQGFLILAYGPTESGAGLLEDLRFLLKTSQENS